MPSAFSEDITHSTLKQLRKTKISQNFRQNESYVRAYNSQPLDVIMGYISLVHTRNLMFFNPLNQCDYCMLELL